MLKPDTTGRIQFYTTHGIMLLWLLFLFYTAFTVLQAYWNISGLFMNIFGLLFLFALVAGTICYPFYFLKQLKQWQKIEQARMNPEALPLYEPQPSQATVLGTQHIPPALKKSMSKHVYIFFNIFMFALCFAFMLFIVVIVWTQPDAQHIDTNQLLTVLFLLPLGFLLFSLLISAILAVKEYERIEASERGLFVQKGLWCSFLPWEEARLFAVGWQEERKPEWFELSGTHALLRWPCKAKLTKDTFSINSGSGSLPIRYQKVTPKEYQQELNRLQSYVALKTHLPLRDLRYPLNKD